MYADYYGRSKHNEVGIFNDENVKELISSRYLKMLVLQESKWER
jgi:alpha-D-ribose 1-methylphosphonate 5-triphosphate synthase subunit PhnL